MNKDTLNKDTLSQDIVEGYVCLAVAAALGAVILIIMIASIAHWVTT